MDTSIIRLEHAESLGSGLQLSPIAINPDYAKEWQASESDFVCLTFNGSLLRPTLYRLGGCNFPNLKKDKYFKLIKHREAFYSDEIMKMSFKHKGSNRSRKHLESFWVIFDSLGNEKVEFPPFKYPGIIPNSCLYSIDGNYYNIETNELIACGTNSIESDDFIFTNNNSYNTDKSKRGVIKIKKFDGTIELFKSTR